MVTVRASDDIRVHVMCLVLSLISGCDLCERYTFAKYKKTTVTDITRVCHLTLVIDILNR